MSEPYDNPFWDINNGARKEEKKSGKIPKIVAYQSLLCWSHTLRSDQNANICGNTLQLNIVIVHRKTHRTRLMLIIFF